MPTVTHISDYMHNAAVMSAQTHHPRPDFLPALPNIAQFPFQQKVGKSKQQTLRSCG